MAAWAITSHHQLRDLLADPRVSKDPNQHWPSWISGDIPADWPLNAWIGVRNMFTAHGADHRRLRGLVSSAFTPRRITGLAPEITRITTGLLDELDTVPAGDTVDLRERFAYPLPISVICGLFGVPDEVRPALRRIVDGVFDTTATPEQAQATQRELHTTLVDLVAAKRDDPGDDLTSALLDVHDADHGHLGEQELLDTLILLIGAGHETTVNLLDQAITALLTHPDQLTHVLNGTRSWNDVISETLRWQPPLASVPLRYAVEDIELDGITIGAGEPILATYAAAERDPDHYEAPDRFDITRQDNGHLAFGHGPHYCLGASLATLEAEIALPVLFDRFPDLTLNTPADHLDPLPGFIANGHATLPVTLKPR